MRTRTYLACLSLAILLGGAVSVYAQTALQFVPVAPCRLVDTRSGQPLQGGVPRSFQVTGACNNTIPANAAAFAFNVTVVPHGALGYLTIWPTGQMQPVVSTLNSLDGRVKANAAIVPSGTGGQVSVFASNTTDLVLDITGYFTPDTTSVMAFYPLTPCRVINQQQLTGGVAQSIDILNSTCGIPSWAQAYSLNFTAQPNGHPLGYLQAWPKGQPQPGTSILNAPTGTTTANAAIIQAGTGGEITVLASNNTNLFIDVNGYFGAPGRANQLALFTLNPCRVLDTRPNGQFVHELTVDVQASPCLNGVSSAGGYVLNATVVPPGPLGYLTLWPDSEPQPVVSTLNALDGAITSNMAIVPNVNGSIDAYASNPTQLVLDISSYMAPAPLLITTTSLPSGTTGQPYQQQLLASGGEPPYLWTVSTGSLPDGLTLSTTGVISGIPTQQGNFNFTVQISDTQSHMAQKNLSISVSTGGLVVLTTQLPQGAQGAPYSATLEAAGGTPPYTWSLTSGQLPPGLNLDANSGVISGTPTMPGVLIFTVQVEDSQSNNAQQGLEIVVNPPLSNSALTGQYAFSFNGYTGGNPIFMAGSFVADGSGNVIAGILDFTNGVPLVGVGFTGTYSIFADGRGTMQFVTGGTLGTLNFNVVVSNQGNGQLIQNNADPNTRGSGIFLVQTPTDFRLPPAGNYAMGVLGADATLNRYAKAGAFQVSGTGVVSGGAEDDNDNGTVGSRNFTGQFLHPDIRFGRGQMTFDFPNDVVNNYEYYAVSSGQFIFIGTDPVSAIDPLTLGSLLVQTGQFSNGSLQGPGVYEVSALPPNGGSPLADTVLGIATFDGHGNGSATVDENRGGTASQHVYEGTYSVAANGRVTTNGFGNASPILYLSNTSQAFVVGQDNGVTQGILEPQTAPPPFNNGSIFGTYLGGTIAPVEAPVVDALSAFVADGSGNMNGTQDFCGSGGCNTQPLASTYQVDATGRAVVNGTLSGIMYVVSPKKVVLLPTGTSNPALSTFLTGLTQ